jgi:hypothetical protein
LRVVPVRVDVSKVATRTILIDAVVRGFDCARMRVGVVVIAIRSVGHRSWRRHASRRSWRRAVPVAVCVGPPRRGIDRVHVGCAVAVVVPAVTHLRRRRQHGRIAVVTIAIDLARPVAVVVGQGSLPFVVELIVHQAGQEEEHRRSVPRFVRRAVSGFTGP